MTTKIAVCCCTWNRPKLLGRLIECFNRQDYQNRELVILDDARQYPNMAGDRWKLVSHQFRWPALGDKRNASVSLVSLDVDAYAFWDDDDIFLGWHLSAIMAALQEARWCQSRQVLMKIWGRNEFHRHATFNERDPNSIGYPGGWGFRREAFEQLGGFAAMSNGEDQELAGRALRILGPSADVITPKYPTPGYVYTHDAPHLSAMGNGESGYQKLGQERIERVDHLDISWPEEYDKWPIGEVVSPRKW